MLIRMRISGTGAESDPFVAPFPVYNLVSIDLQSRRAIIEIPDRFAPDEADAPGSANRPVLEGRPTLIRLSGQRMAHWVEKVRRHYPDQMNKYDPSSME